MKKVNRCSECVYVKSCYFKEGDEACLCAFRKKEPKKSRMSQCDNCPHYSKEGETNESN